MLFTWIWRMSFSGATLAWMGFIFHLSSLSQAEASPPLEPPVISWLGVLRSYAAHVVLYGVLASLAQASLWGWKSDYRLRSSMAVAAFSTLYGISDEYHQSLVGRTGSTADVLVNAAGAIAAVVSLWLVAAWRRGNTAKPP